MTLKIGRVEIGQPDSKPPLTATVSEFSDNGVEVSISGVVSLADQDAASSAMQRIRGLIESQDESVVPLTWPDGPRDLPGFYRVTGGDTKGESGVAVNGVMEWSLSLARVAGFAAPQFESTIVGAQRANTSGSALPWMGLPGSVSGYEVGAHMTPAKSSRTTDTGPVAIYTTSGGQLNNANPSFFVTPEDWYDGAATIRVGGEVVVGRQVRNLPTGWQIDNGIVRLTGQSVGILMEHYSAGAWGTSRTLRPYRRIDASTIDYFDAPDTVTVLRNSPAEAVVRLTYDAAHVVAGSSFSVTIDLSLRRGARMAVMRLRTRGNWQWGCYIENWGTTLTALTGPGSTGDGTAIMGVDVNLGRGVTGTTGYFQLTVANTQFAAGIGYRGTDGAESVLSQWLAAQTEHIDAVVR